MALLMCGTSFAWSIREHATIAQIAENHLTPKAKELIKEYLGGKPMAYYASHADFFRNEMIVDIGFEPQEGKRLVVFPHTYHVDKNFKPYRELVKKGEKKIHGNMLYHLDRITVTDGLIGRIYDMYVKRGFIDDTLFIVTADHGGFGHSHGGTTDDEKIVFWGAAGKTVKPGTLGSMEIRDNAAICLYALGVEQPATWTARVPDDLFVGFTDGERPVFTKLPAATVHRTVDAKIAPDTPVTALFNADAIAAYLPFAPTDHADALGKTAVTAHGKMYYPNGFLGTGYKLDDGCLTLDAFDPKEESFSASFWFKTGGIAGDPTIFANRDRADEKNTGVSFVIRQSAVRLSFGTGEDSWGFDVPLPIDYTDGWMHIIISVDRTQNEASVYLDFKCAANMKMPEKLCGVNFSALPFTLGQDGTGAHPAQLSAIIDEFVLTKEVITPETAEKLQAYYLAD